MSGLVSQVQRLFVLEVVKQSIVWRIQIYISRIHKGVWRHIVYHYLMLWYCHCLEISRMFCILLIKSLTLLISNILTWVECWNLIYIVSWQGRKYTASQWQLENELINTCVYKHPVNVVIFSTDHKWSLSHQWSLMFTFLRS